MLHPPSRMVDEVSTELKIPGALYGGLQEVSAIQCGIPIPSAYRMWKAVCVLPTSSMRYPSLLEGGEAVALCSLWQRASQNS